MPQTAHGALLSLLGKLPKCTKKRKRASATVTGQRAGRSNARVGEEHTSRAEAVLIYSDAYRSPKARVRAEVTAVDDGGVKASEEFEVAAARPRLHNVQAVFDAKLRTKIIKRERYNWLYARFNQQKTLKRAKTKIGGKIEYVCMCPRKTSRPPRCGTERSLHLGGRTLTE